MDPPDRPVDVDGLRQCHKSTMDNEKLRLDVRAGSARYILSLTKCNVRDQSVYVSLIISPYSEKDGGRMWFDRGGKEERESATAEK